MLASARVSRLSASAHVKGSECSRLLASRVCLRLFTSRVPNACVCVLCVCVCLSASVCVCLTSVVLSRVGRLISRLCASASVCVKGSECVCVCLASVCLLVNACGNWLILCVGRHSKSSKGFCYRHTIAVHIDYIDYMNRPLIF